MTQRPVSEERRYALWFGALLLDRGRVVELPNGKPELHIRTGNGVKRLLVCVSETPADRNNGRARIAKVHDLEDDDLPHVVVLVGRDVLDANSLSFVPVSRTRSAWINDGVEYTVPANQLVDFDGLDAWFDKLGPSS